MTQRPVTSMDLDTTETYDRIAELYDWRPENCPQYDLEFFLGAALLTGGPVLELACGTGRVGRLLSRAGIDVIGVDLSLAMLRVFARKVFDEPPSVRSRIRIVCADMRQFALTTEVPLVIVPFRSFNLLTLERDQRECLRCIRDHLSRDGMAIVITHDPTPMLKYIERIGHTGPIGRLSVLPDGRTMTAKYTLEHYDRTRQLLRFVFDYKIDGGVAPETVSYVSVQRYHYAQQLRDLFESSGLVVRRMYGGYDGRPVSEEWNRDLIVEAVRRS